MGKPDQDRPSTWVKYREGLCQNCIGTCCTMPLEVNFQDLLRLGLAEEGEAPKKLAKRLVRAGIIKNYRAASGLYMVAQGSGRNCYFLQDHKCTVYEKRPDVCRGFPTKLGPRVGYCPKRALD